MIGFVVFLLVLLVGGFEAEGAKYCDIGSDPVDPNRGQFVATEDVRELPEDVEVRIQGGRSRATCTLPKGTKVATRLDSRGARVGDFVIACGNPFTRRDGSLYAFPPQRAAVHPIVLARNFERESKGTRTSFLEGMAEEEKPCIGWGSALTTIGGGCVGYGVGHRTEEDKRGSSAVIGVGTVLMIAGALIDDSALSCKIAGAVGAGIGGYLIGDHNKHKASPGVFGPGPDAPNGPAPSNQDDDHDHDRDWDWDWNREVGPGPDAQNGPASSNPN